jgi:hypothetical protein
VADVTRDSWAMLKSPDGLGVTSVVFPSAELEATGVSQSRSLAAVGGELPAVALVQGTLQGGPISETFFQRTPKSERTTKENSHKVG